jgi:hypothetical protein
VVSCLAGHTVFLGVSPRLEKEIVAGLFQDPLRVQLHAVQVGDDLAAHVDDAGDECGAGGVHPVVGEDFADYDPAVSDDVGVVNNLGFALLFKRVLPFILRGSSMCPSTRAMT